MSFTKVDKSYKIVTVGIIACINLIFIAMMIPAFILAAAYATNETIVKFENIAIPITGLLSLIHVIALIVMQVYLFNVESDIKEGIIN